MRNRAKCKKCQEIIESFHLHDYVECKCKEISISGGNFDLYCSAKDWNNFLRIDEKENEIPIKIIENPTEKKEEMEEEFTYEKPGKEELLDMLKSLIKSYENLPQQALFSPVTNSDLHSVLLLIWSLFNSD